jgi:hypothetical protein
MEKRLPTFIVFATLALACSGGDNGGPGGVSPPTGGSGGAPATGGSGGSGAGGYGTGGAGAGGTGAGGTGAGGSAGTGGTAGSDVDAAPGGSGGTGGEGATDAPPAPSSGAMLGWYEAEAVPPNQVIKPAGVGNCGAGACPSGAAIKEGMECCSGGKKVSQLIRGKGQLQINGISAPADGMYDVTWWFHCGKNDNFGDANCGGVPHTPSGCRPHLLVVNGTQLPKTYEFPCFPGSWGQIHASTTTVPLKAGATNSIKIFATPGRDAADLDAIAVYPAGMGTPPVAGSH